MSFKSLNRSQLVNCALTENRAAVISSKGSRSLRLQGHALEIFQFCVLTTLRSKFQKVADPLVL